MSQAEKSIGVLTKNPELRALTRKRRKTVFILVGVLLSAYIFNLLLMTLMVDVAALKISAGSQITIGVAYSIGLILLSAATAAIYSWVSGRYFDPLSDEIRKTVSPEREP